MGTTPPPDDPYSELEAEDLEEELGLEVRELDDFAFRSVDGAQSKLSPDWVTFETASPPGVVGGVESVVGCAGQESVPAEIDVAGERFPAASYASTATMYVVPQARPPSVAAG